MWFTILPRETRFSSSPSLFNGNNAPVQRPLAKNNDSISTNNLRCPTGMERHSLKLATFIHLMI